MKKVFVFVLAIIVVSIPAYAGLFDLGWDAKRVGIPLIFGTEKREISALAVFRDSTGRVLVPQGDMVPVPSGCQGVLVNIYPEAPRAEGFDVRWTLRADAFDWGDMDEAAFDPHGGWHFAISKNEIGDLARLRLGARGYGTKKYSVRFIFKVTYAKGSSAAYDQIILAVVDESQYAGNGGGTDFQPAIDALARRDQQIVDRLTNVEGYLKNAGGKPLSSGGYGAPAGQMVNIAIQPTGSSVRYPFVLHVKDTYGQIQKFTITGYGQSIALPCGQATIGLEISGRFYGWDSRVIQIRPTLGSITVGMN